MDCQHQMMWKGMVADDPLIYGECDHCGHIVMAERVYAGEWRRPPVYASEPASMRKGRSNRVHLVMDTDGEVWRSVCELGAITFVGGELEPEARDKCQNCQKRGA